MNKDDILIVKYPFWMKSDQATRLYEGILKQKENGVIILPDYCDVVIAPKDVEIKSVYVDDLGRYDPYTDSYVRGE